MAHNECVICLEDLTDFTSLSNESIQLFNLPCKCLRVYHYTCFLDWYNTIHKIKCPCCNWSLSYNEAVNEAFGQSKHNKQLQNRILYIDLTKKHIQYIQQKHKHEEEIQIQYKRQLCIFTICSSALLTFFLILFITD